MSHSSESRISQWQEIWWKELIDIEDQQSLVYMEINSPLSESEPSQF